MSGPVLNKMQLDEAFNHLIDIMDRCLCPFLLLGETARSIVKDNSLNGDGLYIGIRKPDFNDSTQSMLRTISSPNFDIHLGIDNFKQDDNGFSWSFKEVPINVRVIKQKYEFINNPTDVWYYADTFKIPNPFDKYWTARSLIV